MNNEQPDFAAEINTLFQSHDFNFGKGAIPVDIVRNAVLQSACGYHNGSTAQSIILHLGYIKRRSNRLTKKGKAFLWWAIKDSESAKIANKAKSLLEFMTANHGSFAYGSIPNSDIMLSLQRINENTPKPKYWPDEFPWPPRIPSEVILGGEAFND